MTPGRASHSGTDVPTRPGTRGGGARGSVSGVCPEASRRRTGIQVMATGSLPAVLTRMIASLVSPSPNLAGRSSCGCPALFGERDREDIASLVHAARLLGALDRPVAETEGE